MMDLVGRQCYRIVVTNAHGQDNQRFGFFKCSESRSLRIILMFLNDRDSLHIEFLKKLRLHFLSVLSKEAKNLRLCQA